MKINALITCITALLILLAAEAVVRMGSEINSRGHLIFRGYVLDFHATLVERQRRNVEDYLEAQDQAMHIYDEWLGWTFRPNAARQEYEFTINSAGMRSQREYSRTPPPDTLRIALFGDSFTADAEVGNDETWGHQLEMKLNQAGIRAEALNFGVGYYGMGQAFLRWRHQGQHYAPDIVIFGFQPGNLNRNVNIFSSMYFGHLPFSKPRFVLTESGGGLELLNSPVMPLEQIADEFESFGSHPWAEHEYYYSSRWWSFSQLAAFLHVALASGEAATGPTSERGMVGKAIVDAFAAEVEARESSFFVMYLPPRRDVYNSHNGIPQSHQHLLDYFDDAYHYIAFEDQLDRSYLDYGWAPNLHYGPEISSIAGQAAADEIQSCIESGACELPRFEDRNVIFISE